MDQMELNLNQEIAQNSLDRHRLPLPLELNCQIFECLKVPIQKKFICGLGRGIYGMFRQQVLTKSKRLRNPKQNGFKSSTKNAIISSNGLEASDNTENFPIVLAKKGFYISSVLSRKEDNFPGTILYYFEVTRISEKTTSADCAYFIGLSDGNNCDRSNHGFTPNSYCMSNTGSCYFLSSERKYKKFEWPNGVNGVPKRNGPGNVAGCGLLLNEEHKLSIFFTLNGILLGKQMPISTSVNYLYPTIEIYRVSVEANFGNDPAKPFVYNI